MLQSQISKDMVKTSLTVKTSLSQLYQTKSKEKKTKLLPKNVPFWSVTDELYI